MSDQNIFDNEIFFEEYRKLRNNSSAANDIVEKPALFSLCPELSGKAVLDFSEKMLDIAGKENKYKNVTFIRMSMSDLSLLQDAFDIVFSSLAIHYIENFDKLLADVYQLLEDNGTFVFSQEHPFTTAMLKEKPRWAKDSDGNILHYNLSDYSIPGVRKTSWFVDNVIKYHRSFSSIINSLSTAGFIIEKMLEPLPNEATMEKYPSYKKYYHKPDFLLIKARKNTV